jgi:hypothetical protein
MDEDEWVCKDCDGGNNHPSQCEWCGSYKPEGWNK